MIASRGFPASVVAGVHMTCAAPLVRAGAKAAFGCAATLLLLRMVGLG